MKKYINGKYLDLTEEEVNLLDKNLPILPLTENERLCEIEKINNVQDELIDVSLFAIDEMFCIIEPLLSNVMKVEFNIKGVNKMIDMYVAMIIRGLKTIDEIPLRYRDEVENVLKSLEK